MTSRLNEPDGVPSQGAPRIWSFSHCVLDERTLELKVRGQLADIERKPLEVLLHLLRHAGEVVTKDELIESVWPGRIITDSNLTKTVAVVRATLQDSDQTAIKTVHGYGYRLMAPVSVQGYVAESPARFDFRSGESPPLRPHWRLDSRLGAGGHGEVWLAHHTGTKESRVFKFAEEGRSLTSLKREITLNRLLRETLPERLDFLRLLDWNIEEPPFFIECDFLPFGNLAAWAHARGGLNELPMKVRLELLAQVAEAVAAAHSVGVLHKDLKPANVLVFETDGKLGIKLADFGSGGVVDTGALDEHGITRMGFTQTVQAGADTSGTPLYLAPEVMAGQPYTVKCDVYALGVMLYQFVAGDVRKGLAPGWEKHISDELLRDDIAQASAGDPADRLADAGLFAQRLRSLEQRHRALIEVRESNARMQRIQQEAAEQSRQAELVMTGARARRRWVRATMAMLVAGVVTASMLYLHASQLRIEAERAVAVSDAVNDFLNSDLLGSADPTAGATRGLTLEHVLDRAARKAERLEAQPEAAARVRDTLARAYYQQGELAAARAQWQRAAELREQAFGSDSVERLSTMLRIPATLLVTGKIGDSCALADQLAGQLAKIAAPDTDLLRARYNQAQCMRFQFKNSESAGLYRQIKQDLERLGIPDDLLYVETLIGLAFASTGTPDSEAYQRELLAYLARTRGEGDILSSRTRTYLGISLMVAGRLDEADREMTRAAADQDAWIGEYGSTVANVNSWLSVLRLEQGRFDEAAASATIYLENPVHREVISAEKWFAMLALAEARLLSTRYDEAMRNAQAALDIVLGLGQMERSIPADWARVIQADALREQNKLTDAERVVPDEPDADSRTQVAAMVFRSRGLLRLAQGRRQDAVELLKSAAEISRQADGVNHWRSRRLDRELEKARG